MIIQTVFTVLLGVENVNQNTVSILWSMHLKMNSYKLIQGDCFQVLPTIDDESVDLIIADPPYNLGIAKWDIIDDFVSWNQEWLLECVRTLKNNSALYVFGITPQIFEIYNIIKDKLDFKFCAENNIILHRIKYDEDKEESIKLLLNRVIIEEGIINGKRNN